MKVKIIREKEKCSWNYTILATNEGEDYATILADEIEIHRLGCWRTVEAFRGPFYLGSVSGDELEQVERDEKTTGVQYA